MSNERSDIKDKVNYYVRMFTTLESTGMSFDESLDKILDDLFGDEYPKWDDAGAAPLKIYVTMHAVRLMIISDLNKRRKYYDRWATNSDGYKTCLKGTEILFDMEKVKNVDIESLDSIIECLYEFNQRFFVIMGV
jgi:hypothetical protein